MKFGYKGIGGTKFIIKRALNIFLRITEEKLKDFHEGSENYGNLDWDFRRIKETIDSIDQKVTPIIMEKSGGQWLACAREWIQWNFHNGSNVTWGSQDVLRGKDLTVQDIEKLAAMVAAAAINEDRE